MWSAALSALKCQSGDVGEHSSTNYSSNSCHYQILNKCQIRTVYASSHLTFIKILKVKMVTLIL